MCVLQIYLPLDLTPNRHDSAGSSFSDLAESTGALMLFCGDSVLLARPREP